MAASNISNVSVSTGQVRQQKAGNSRELTLGSGTNFSAEGSVSGNPGDDTVTLRQSGKPVNQGRVLGPQEIGQQVLPRAKAAILADNKTAIAAQANFTTQTAKEMLSER